MPTNSLAGFRSKLRVSSDGTDYVTVGEVTSLQVSRRANVIRASHHDDETFVAKLAGKVDASIVGTCNYVPGDAGQALLDTVQRTPGARVHFKLLAYSAVGAPMLVGVGVVTDLSRSTADESVQSLSFTIDVDGALTPATAASGDLA